MHFIAIFASGSGSNARNIMEHFKNHRYYRIALIVTNRKAAGVIAHAEEMGVACSYLPSSTFRDNPSQVIALLKKANVDFVVLAGFLLKVPPPVVNAYGNRIINIHPSLLPAFGGEGMYGDHVHEAVIESGVPKSGITIHRVNNEYDEGEVIFQASVDVIKGETPASLKSKIQSLEHRWFPLVLEQVLQKTFKNH